ARFKRLLEQSLPAGALANLVEWRWHAAERLWDFETIAADLSSLRTHLGQEDEAGWVRLLLAAADRVAWVGGDAADTLFTEIRQEIEQRFHVHAQFGEAISRLDFLVDLSETWKRVKSNQRDQALVDLLELLPLTWTQSPHELRPQCFACLQDLAEDP